MENSFKTAIKTLRTSNSNLQIRCINGCCYGKDNNPDKRLYFKKALDHHLLYGDDGLEPFIFPSPLTFLGNNDIFVKHLMKSMVIE